MKLSYAALIVAMYDLAPGEKNALAEIITDEHIELLDQAINKLSTWTSGERMTTIICRYYGIGYDETTLEVIGKELPSSIGIERVRQIRQKALRFLRENIGVRPLVEWLIVNHYSSSWMNDTLSLPTVEQLDALKVWTKTFSTVEAFLLACSPDCSSEHSCPTCRAKLLLAQAGLEKEILGLAQEWYKGSDDDRDSILINTLNWSIRTRNCLRHEGIHTLGVLVQKSEPELLRSPNLGRKSINEIKEHLEKFGLSLRS